MFPPLSTFSSSDRLPSGCTAVDALHVAKSPARTYGGVTAQEWPEREGRGGAGKPKLTLELCANYALSQLELPADPNRRRAAPPKKRSLPSPSRRCGRRTRWRTSC